MSSSTQGPPGDDAPPDSQTTQDINLRFFQHFQRETAALNAQIDALALSPSPSGADSTAAAPPPTIESIRAGITRLSQEAADASSYAPPHDQRTYAEGVKALGERLAVAKASVAPRAKFAFKGKLKLGGGVGGDQPKRTLAAAPKASGGGGNERFEDGGGRFSSGEASHESSMPHDASVSVADRHDARVVLDEDESRTATTAAVTDLHRCVVDLSARTITKATTGQAFASVRTRRVAGSLVVLGRVDGPAHVTELQRCVLVVACRQFRMHACKEVDVYLECGSHPIIEDCEGVRFAPLPDAYKNGNPKITNDQWDQVDDFKWLKPEPSPNWSILPEEKRINESLWHNSVSGLPDRSVDDVLKAVGVE